MTPTKIPFSGVSLRAVACHPGHILSCRALSQFVFLAVNHQGFTAVCIAGPHAGRRKFIIKSQFFIEHGSKHQYHRWCDYPE